MNNDAIWELHKAFTITGYKIAFILIIFIMIVFGIPFLIYMIRENKKINKF